MRRLILTAALLVGMAVPPAWADFDAGVAAYDSGDYETAFREFKPLAEQGDAHAQFNLGYMYHKGEGVPRGARCQPAAGSPPPSRAASASTQSRNAATLGRAAVVSGATT